MHKIQVQKQSLLNVVLIDSAILFLACMVPAMSHLSALPLYQFNPMLWMMLLSMLLVRDHRNAFVMAAMLPFVSCLVSGMPSPDKAICMVAELEVVALLVAYVASRKSGWTLFGLTVAAVVAGKCVYYAVKALIISSVSLVGTPVAVQLLAAVAASALFAFFLSRRAS